LAHVLSLSRASPFPHRSILVRSNLALIRKRLVSWQWGSNKPSGEVAEVVKEGQAAIESNKGNTITKNAEPNDPAVHITRPGNDVVKNASELEVKEPKASDAANGGEKAAAQEPEKSKEDDKEMKDVEEKTEGNGVAQAGEKRDHAETETNGNGIEKPDESTEEPAEATAVPDSKDDEPPAKKQKKDDETAGSDKKEGEPAKKGRGRPKKAESNGTAKGPAKKKEPKKAATETGEPRRSGRNSVSK
jgi:hypothetical protein